MKSNDLRGMPLNELEEQLQKSTKELFESRLSATVKELTNTSKLRGLRRDVARLRQVIAEKQEARGAAK